MSIAEFRFLSQVGRHVQKQRQKALRNETTLCKDGREAYNISRIAASHNIFGEMLWQKLGLQILETATFGQRSGFL